MLNKINIYILKRFLFTFILTFIIFSSILFIGDFVEQFRKSTGKDVPFKIILQLTLFNFPSLISFTLPIASFFAALMAFIILIRNSEMIIIKSSGISQLNFTIPAVILYLFIGVFFVTAVNPLLAYFDKLYSDLEYVYIDKVDKFASITKNGLWLKQENLSNEISSILFAKNIKDQGQNLIDFMILEYDSDGAYQGRYDGQSATLMDGYWEMSNTQVTPKYGETIFKENITYQTNIKIEDISNSLSSPSSISIWRLAKFINFLEELGYSAVDFKMHFYNLIFLPVFIASLVLLASSFTVNVNHNDKYSKLLLLSFISIFTIYFLSNIFDALGSSSQIHPILAKIIPPIIVFFVALCFYQINKIKRNT